MPSCLSRLALHLLHSWPVDTLVKLVMVAPEVTVIGVFEKL